MSSNTGLSEGVSTRTVLLAVVALGVLAVAAAGLAGAQDDQFEPNDAFNESATPERGSYENLDLGGENPDYYELDLEADQEVNVTLAFSHAQGDVDLEIQSANRTTLDRSMSASDGEQIQFTAPSTGSYYVHVWPFWESSTSYDLHLESDQRIQASGDSSGGLLGGNTLVLVFVGGVLVAGGYVVFVRE